LQKVAKAKANLLDQFYEHLEEDDWLDGVDIYQAGRVGGLETYHGLVTGKVSGTVRRPEEVRLKIHPSGHCIQWIECTCKKNRTKGLYCEHIAAFMIHLDRERSEIFASLDTSMPLKPPAGARKKNSAQSTERKGASSNKMTAAAQKILEHLHGNIQSVSLLAHGPVLRVRIEIKEGQLTHYDLDLDAAAHFLQDQDGLTNATAEVKNLEIFDTPVELGTRIYLADNEKIIAERVVAIKLKRKPTPKQIESIRVSVTVDKYARVAPGETKPEDGVYIFIPMKTGSKYLGREYFFMPGRGYYPLQKDEIRTDWNDLPLTKTFKEDDAAGLVNSAYNMYLSTAPIYLDAELKDQEILDAPELSEVKILHESEGWFRLDPRYGEGKGSVSMVELMKQHRGKKRKFIRSGKTWLRIPEFVTEHEWILDENGDSIKVDALGLMRLKAAVGDFDQFVGSKKMLHKIRNQMEFTPEGKTPSLKQTKLDLRHYQEIGLRWLWWLYKNNMHGLLADEMGLGKTHQAMALMSAIQTENPDARFIVICPTTVLDHWLDKMIDFAPNLKPIKYHGPKRSALLTEFERNGRVLITSYGILLRDIRQLSEMQWGAMTLDEAHFIKNNDTATYKAVCRLTSRIRVCLTGTPIENHLSELKNLFDFLVPGYLGSDEYFRKNFLTPLNTDDGAQAELALQKLIHPFKLRRTKDLVLPDLPEKVEDLRHCSLSDEQIKLYREVVAMKARPLVEQLENDENPIPFLHVFATLTMLKQICNHPALLKKGSDYRKHESGKFELLKEILQEALDSGHKVVIYSQYVEMIRIIKSYLTEAKIGHVTLTGQTRNRGEVIKNFQTDDNIKIFVGSLLAGGIGIDLTAASVVVHYDRWWNASKENQATDRVHRIGQNKNVQVMKLINRGTLEEKIDRMIRSKQQLFERFMDKDEEIFKTLSRQELIELLQ
jgi:superfamily II DNA or RNA helicase